MLYSESQIRQDIGATLLLNKIEGGYDEDATLNTLIDKYGMSAESKESKKRERTKEETPKTDGEEEKGSAKKPRKPDTIVNEANRPIAEAIKEMGGFYFKNGDSRKGGVYAKAAKSLRYSISSSYRIHSIVLISIVIVHRDTEMEVKTKKDAISLKGIGAGIGVYIEEYLQTGSITKLEELRAGTA